MYRVEIKDHAGAPLLDTVLYSEDEVGALTRARGMLPERELVMIRSVFIELMT